MPIPARLATGLPDSPGIYAFVGPLYCEFPLRFSGEPLANMSAVGLGLVPFFAVDLMLLPTGLVPVAVEPGSGRRTGPGYDTRSVHSDRNQPNSALTRVRRFINNCS